MTTWTRDERERAYTHLCEVLTEIGPEGELQFLARLSLLLMEGLGDAAAFAQCLGEAAKDDDIRHVGGGGT